MTSEVGNSHKSNETQLMRIDGACSKITTVSNVTWIAVIRKGGHCTVKDKLHNALVLSNASAVIIIDNTLSKVHDRYGMDLYYFLNVTILHIFYKFNIHSQVSLNDF